MSAPARHRPRASAAGQPVPARARRSRDGGTNFAVASGAADGMHAVPVRRRRRARPGSRCRTTTPASGTASSRASAPGRPTATAPTGPYDPARGLRCNPAKLLLDPYARAIDGEVTLRARGARLRRRRPGRAEHARLGRARAAQPGRRRRVRAGRDDARPSRRTPTRSSTRCTSRASPCAHPGRARRSCAAPTPGSATRRPSPTCSTWA